MRKLLFGGMLLLLLATTAFADSIHSVNSTRPLDVSAVGNLSSVQTQLNAIYGSGVAPNAYTGQHQSGVWQLTGTAPGGTLPTLVFESAGNANQNSFGIWTAYEVGGPIETAEIFSGPNPVGTMAALSWEAGNPDTVTIVNLSNLQITSKVGINRYWFGFYIKTPDGNGGWNTFYTADQLNGGTPQALAYLGPGVNGAGRWTLAFEDLAYAGSDKDFNDMIVSIESITPVPDGGTTLVLLGGALLGLETLRRKLRF